MNHSPFSKVFLEGGGVAQTSCARVLLAKLAALAKPVQYPLLFSRTFRKKEGHILLVYLGNES